MSKVSRLQKDRSLTSNPNSTVRIPQVQLQLVVAQEKWEAYRTSVAAMNQRIINNYNVKIQSLQDAIVEGIQHHDAERTA